MVYASGDVVQVLQMCSWHRKELLDVLQESLWKTLVKSTSRNLTLSHCSAIYITQVEDFLEPYTSMVVTSKGLNNMAENNLPSIIKMCDHLNIFIKQHKCLILDNSYKNWEFFSIVYLNCRFR